MPPDDRRSNEELLARYSGADFAAFDQFYRRTERLLLNYTMSRLGSRQDAEEALQETYLRIHASVARYDASQPALAWAFTIARNVCIDMLRRRGRKAPSSSVPPETILSPSSAADDVLAARQELAELFARLTHDEQALLKSRFLDEESYETIAEGQGGSSDSTRQRLSRLLRKLRG